MFDQILTTVIKGISNRIKRKKPTDSTIRLSWMQEKILKHQEDKFLKVLRVKGNGLVLHYKRPYELLYTFKELFYKELYKFKTDKTKPYIIDCGSNIGLSILYFKSIYPNAEILAFEPDAETFEVLKKNISGNKLTEVEIRQAAVWVNNEPLFFESLASESSRIVTYNVKDPALTRVEAVRLSEILAKREVDFLKLDIEGAETEVMKDCEHVLHKVKNLFLEYHGTVDEAESFVQNITILKDQGFKLYIKMGADTMRSPFIERRSKGMYDVQLNIFAFR